MVALTNESKNAITLSNENKVGDTITWDDATGTWVDNEGTWDNPENAVNVEAKNTAITLSNEAKL